MKLHDNPLHGSFNKGGPTTARTPILEPRGFMDVQCMDAMNLAQISDTVYRPFDKECFLMNVVSMSIKLFSSLRHTHNTPRLHHTVYVL